jgi:aminoglycoside phosphotransferase (APT) family kinase protein
VTLHSGEIVASEDAVRSLLDGRWADLPITPAGAGTDNTMYRLGPDLLVRLPRTAEKAVSLVKELAWLPRLAPLLPLPIPSPVLTGAPTPDFPLPWAIYRWIEGVEVGPATVGDWAAFGSDLASFVSSLHRVDLMGATRTGDLSWYRGGSLSACDTWITRCIEDCRSLVDLDVDTLLSLWRAAVALPDPTAPHVWLHGDLRPANLLARAGRLHAVVDFGCLSIGRPDAEHAMVWDLPPAARSSYRDALSLEEPTWQRARAWAIAEGTSGLSYYRDTFPAFTTECHTKLASILAAP